MLADRELQHVCQLAEQVLQLFGALACTILSSVGRAYADTDVACLEHDPLPLVLCCYCFAGTTGLCCSGEEPQEH